MLKKLSMRSLVDITFSTIKRLMLLITSSKYDSKSTNNQLKLEISDAKIIEINHKFLNPQLCATLVCDIYKNLRVSEMKKRPWTEYIAKAKKDSDIMRRAFLVDWLVEVADTYNLDTKTLYLTINYMDRYLSGCTMDSKDLQMLGVACLIIASKFEIADDSPSVRDFLDLTPNTCDDDEVLQMECIVLNFLEFELAVPTVLCFLSLFVCADQTVTDQELLIDQAVDEDSSIALECMSNYLAELSLLDYHMICYAPSMIAASSIFLARFILLPSRRPWNSTLQNYTLYKPSDLFKCVKALHCLCCHNPNSTLQAIRVKYSQLKFKCVAEEYCPPSIPKKYFLDL